MFSSGDFAHHNDCSQRDRHSATRAGLRRHDDVNWSGSARFARGEHEAATVEIGSEIRSARRAASRSGLKLALPELCAGTTRVPHRCRGCSPGVHARAGQGLIRTGLDRTLWSWQLAKSTGMTSTRTCLENSMASSISGEPSKDM